MAVNKKTSLKIQGGFACDPAEARTQDPRLKRALLYQLSYGIRLIEMRTFTVIPLRLELRTHALKGRCSTN